jgi:hypothetical protein
MRHTDQQLRLDQPATYRIQVQGCVGDDWADWFDGMVVTVSSHPRGPSTTTLTGTLVDQAALQGLLSKLYNLGLPLLSVQILSCRR